MVKSLIFTLLLLVSDYSIGIELSLYMILALFFLNFFLVSFIKWSDYFYLLFVVVALFQHLFFSYFQRVISSTDVYNFFTHVGESFETMVSFGSIFVLAVVVFLVNLIILWFLRKVKTQTYYLSRYIKYPVLFLLLFINTNIYFDIDFSTIQNSHLNYSETPMYPIRNDKTNIVFIIGESMKYDDYVEKKLQKQKHFYKKIYAGATNTDVSVPLLLNVKNNPLKLSKKNQSNLFKLAKKNSFKTAFISMQSEKALFYIKPFLQLQHVDYYKSYEKDQRTPKFDFLLLEELKKFDFSKKNFIVLEQIGQHSPYLYFDGEKSQNHSINYQKSLDYSFEFYRVVYNYLSRLKKPFVLVYTSDHGEFSGEGGRFGHNCFEPTVYKVPMFVASNTNIPYRYKDIKSHLGISHFLTYLLGYEKSINFSEKKIIINGTMLSREDRFQIVQ